MLEKRISTYTIPWSNVGPTCVCSVARQANKGATTVDEDNLTMNAGVRRLDLLVILPPQSQDDLRRVCSCEIVVLHASLDVCRTQVREEAALRLAPTCDTVQHIWQSLLGLEGFLNLILDELFVVARNVDLAY